MSDDVADERRAMGGARGLLAAALGVEVTDTRTGTSWRLRP